jgi:hypothetical protein
MGVNIFGTAKIALKVEKIKTIHLLTNYYL